MEFSMTDQNHFAASTAAAVARAEDLFRRYPHLSSEEIEEGVTFLTKGRHLDIGLVSGNSDLRDNLDAFRRDHARALNPGLGEHAIFILIFLLLVGGLIYLLAR